MRHVLPLPPPPTGSRKRELVAPKDRRGLPACARALARGEINQNQFVQQTSRDYQSFAQRLFRFWTLPASVEVADIVQQLYLSTFDHLKRWDPTQAPIGRYIAFNMHAETKRWLNAQRGAKRGSDPSMFDQSVEDVFARDPEQREIEIGELVPVDCEAENLALVRELVAGVDAGGGEAECLLAMLFEDDDSDSLATVVEHGGSRTTMRRTRERAAELLAD